MYNIYQTSDGFYYPIAMTNQEFQAAAPVATGNPELGLRLRQQPFGGAIDGVQMIVGPSVQEEKDAKSTAAAATRQAYLDSASEKLAAAKTATHANVGVPLYNAASATGTGLMSAASATGTAASNAFFGTPEQQLEAVKLEGRKAFESIPSADRLPLALSPDNKALIEGQRNNATDANAALTNSVELAEATTHKDIITAARDRITQLLINYRKMAPPPAPALFHNGGRRRTNNAWLRSKPVRYTRRKFYK
jgi:hypothetical protein